MNDAIKDFLIKIMSAFPHSFIKYYVYGGFEMILDEKNMLWFSLEKIESDIELNGYVEELKQLGVEYVDETA